MNLDYWTARAMRAYGGSFVSALGAAVEAADDNNLAKIKAAWPECWEKYEALGAKLKAADDAKDTQP